MIDMEIPNFLHFLSNRSMRSVSLIFDTRNLYMERK